MHWAASIKFHRYLLTAYDVLSMTLLSCEDKTGKVLLLNFPSWWRRAVIKTKGDNCYEGNRTGCQNRQCYHAGTGGCFLRLGSWRKLPEGEDAELRRWPL